VGDAGEPKKPCIRWASRSPEGKGQFLRVVQTTEKHGVTAAVYAMANDDDCGSEFSTGHGNSSQAVEFQNFDVSVEYCKI